MYKVLIPISNTYKAARWCRENFGKPVTKYIFRFRRNGGGINIFDEGKSRWTYKRNTLTSTWKFKNLEDSILFKLTWT